MAAFGDLCLLKQSDPRDTEKLIVKAVSLGYRTIAVNTTFHLKKVAKQKNNPCPEPTDWELLSGVQNLKKVNRNLQVLNRVTVPLEENGQLHQLASDTLHKYDLLAVNPATDKLFLQACSSLEVDLISLDLTARLPFYLKMPQVRQAIDRGVSFEITYGPMIRDNTQRRYVISNAADIIRATKGRGVIMSSGADGPLDLRGPYDVANLGELLGLKQEKAKSAVSRNIRALLYHVEARKATGKSTISGSEIDTDDDDKDLAPPLKKAKRTVNQ
ncbi:predicted protein [Nematostella vectensis]|uniref:Ribonuclease P protein subunit p30 n=1 Tax=Nematostella vectensis TaxID=45351 RepID=A7S216_NEMVE|nr:predicted protein [Nematostella vectensis]|eukprot:XP_001634220.1 predicted protein [Nematostella vectensis]